MADDQNGDWFLDEKKYLDCRVNDQLSYYQGRASSAKLLFTTAQRTIIIFGVIVPVLVNLPAVVLPPEYIRAIVTILTLIIACFTGLANFHKWGDLWLSYRFTEETLKHEKFLFLTKSGQYSNSDTAFSRFVQNTESIISSEHIRFRTLIEEARRPVSQSSRGDKEHD